MPTTEEVMDTLKKVYDPEIGIDIVSLGLVYDVKVENEKVTVKMTMTTPGCPLILPIINAAKSAIESLESVKEADVQLVWDPPWTPDMMSPEAKKLLGLE